MIIPFPLHTPPESVAFNVIVDKLSHSGVTGLIVASALGSTVIVMFALFVHPYSLVPITEYVVIDIGLIITLSLVPKLCDHEYCVASPITVNMLLSPKHIELLEALIIITGIGFTVI